MGGNGAIYDGIYPASTFSHGCVKRSGGQTTEFILILGLDPSIDSRLILISHFYSGFFFPLSPFIIHASTVAFSWSFHAEKNSETETPISA
jgi:hypothetical protein